MEELSGASGYFSRCYEIVIFLKKNRRASALCRCYTVTGHSVLGETKGRGTVDNNGKEQRV